MPRNNNSMMTPRFILGVFLVLMGVVLTLDQIGVVQAHHVLRFWPAALIILGLVTLQRGDGHSAVRGLVLIVVGGWLLLNTLGVVSVQLWEFIWPLLLVIFGARIMTRSQNRKSNTNSNQSGAADGSMPGPATGGAGPSALATAASSSRASTCASQFALLSSCKRRWGNSMFASAEATAILGGIELDLRDALMGPTGSAVIEVFCIMGGVSILIPANWTVSQEIAPVMGGVDDNTRSVPTNPTQHLIVRGTVVMGGIEIAN
jgi:predicted membrane protein